MKNAGRKQKSGKKGFHPEKNLFIRKTKLETDERNKNFLMTDIDILKTLVSKEADEVTPLMTKIYMNLRLAIEEYGESPGVIHIRGEMRDGEWVKAWDILCEIAGVSSATAKKALDWMHDIGVIGYIPQKNGIGIRICFNRAKNSIEKAEARAQKNLPEKGASSKETDASQDETAFNDSFANRDGFRRKDKTAQNARVQNPVEAEHEKESDSLSAIKELREEINNLKAEIIEMGIETEKKLRAEQRATLSAFELKVMPKAVRVATCEYIKQSGKKQEGKIEGKRNGNHLIVGGKEAWYQTPAMKSDEISDEELNLLFRKPTNEKGHLNLGVKADK